MTESREPHAERAPGTTPPEAQLPVVAQWPPNQPLLPAETIETVCAACAKPWRIHRDMAGFRLRCSCTAWIDVPKAEPQLPARFEDLSGPPVLPKDAFLPSLLPRDAEDRIELPLARGEVTEAEIPVHQPMAPGSVQRVRTEVHNRWSNAAFLELGLLMAAFLVPPSIANLLLEGEAQTLFMPFTSLATGVLVLLFAGALSPFAFRGFRSTQPRFFVEALVVAVALYALAMGWMSLVDKDGEGSAMIARMREVLGTGWLLFVIGFCPAVFEEIAFRDVVQGRFLALLGRFQGLVATGAAFGLCHGVTMALPFHVGIGIYLCLLRERSRSLWPCILAHFTYNGLIAVTA